MAAVESHRGVDRFIEPRQPIGKDVGGDAFGGGNKVAVAGLAAQQVTNDQQGPAVAEDVERAGDRAPRALGVATAGGARLYNLHIASITVTLSHNDLFLASNRMDRMRLITVAGLLLALLLAALDQ